MERVGRSKLAIEPVTFDTWAGDDYSTYCGPIRDTSSIVLTDAFGEPQKVTERLPSAWVAEVDWDTDKQAPLGRLKGGLRLVRRQRECWTVVPTVLLEPTEVGHTIGSLFKEWKPAMNPEEVARAIMHALERYSIDLEGSSESGLSGCLSSLESHIAQRRRGI